MRAFFIGDPILVNGYRLSGVEVVPVTSADELVDALDTAYKTEGVGIILVDRDYSSQVKAKIEGLRVKYALPVLVEVPGRRGGPDIDIKSTITRIMGAKI
jgi:vacuolar-type H+-ATPase subunit F/Vma7